MITTIPRAAGELVKGTWMPQRLGRTGDRRLVIHVSCPKCGAKGSIDREDPDCGHTVNSLGHVAPKLTCPDPACGWEGVVRLGGFGRGAGEQCG